jgi:serine protease Do
MSIKNSIFKIHTAAGSGSGFYVKEKDIVVTNHHVINGYRQVAVENVLKERVLAKVVLVNPQTDLAFLKLEKSLDASGCIINPGISVNAGDRVFVHGFPFGMPYTITEGIISSPSQLVDGRKLVQTDAAVNPGNSGGPILNTQNELIAITSSKFTNADNMGFGIPLNTFLSDLESLNVISDFNRFYLKCDSCGTLIDEKSEYCNNCGNSLDTQVFFESDKENKEFITSFVEDALKLANINPVLARSGKEYWEFHYGTSLIRIFIYNTNYLYVTSPLNEMPQQNVGELLKYILSNNISPYKLGIYKNVIFLSYRISISDLYTSYATQIKNHIAQLITKADELDNFFAEKFKCPYTSFSRIVEENI